jgi:hypothetical protein
MFTIWAGIDIGKEHHHCVALDARGERRLSRRVGNDEPELIRDVLALAESGEALWTPTAAAPLCSSGSCLAKGSRWSTSPA